MARCGRCGLFNKYPESHPEATYAGVCMWYQIRFRDDQVFEKRDCPDFFEKIPGLHPMDSFEYKSRREDMRDGFLERRYTLILSMIAMGLSIAAILMEATG